MTSTTLATSRQNADGTAANGTITIDPGAPGNPKPPTRPAMLTGAAFLARFALAEYTAIRQASAAQLAAGNGQMEMWIEAVRAGPFDVNGEAAQAAQAALVAANLLTQDRATIIFAPP